MVNHSPGGISGERYTKWLEQLLTFLCCSYHRVCLRIVIELFIHHQVASAFVDGYSGTHDNSETHSTRMIELVIFERKLLTLISELSYDWQNKLPLSHAFLLKESKRHVRNSETNEPLTKEQSYLMEQQFKVQVNLQVMTGIEAMSDKSD